MNNKVRAPLYMYFILAVVLFIGWIFAYFTDWYGTPEAGFTLIVLLIVFEVVAVILRSQLREQHHLDNNRHHHSQA